MTTPFATEANFELADEFCATGMNENAARILAAALILFAEKGYAATTVREIVRTAEVTNPMLYYYFESKQGVFKALLDFLFQAIDDEVRRVLRDEFTLEQNLRAVARVHFDGCRHAPDVLRFIYTVIFGPRKSRPDFDVFTVYKNIESQVQRQLHRAIDTAELRPAAGFDAPFLTERFFGLISDQLMKAFALYDQMPSSTPAESAQLNQALDHYLNDQALDRLMTFFLNGATAPHGDDK